METIIAGLISAASAIIVCVISQAGSNKKQQILLEKQTALIEYKLDELSRRVEKHNGVVERVYNLEKQDAIHDEQIKQIEAQLTGGVS